MASTSLSLPSLKLQFPSHTSSSSRKNSSSYRVSIRPIQASVSEIPPYISSPSQSPSSSSSPPVKQAKLPARKVPGDYGLPLVGPWKDRLDYFYNQGKNEFFKSRIQKHQSTVFRTNMPPGPFISFNPNVVVLLDGKSFPVLFDVSKVEKKDLFTGTFMPSTDLTGGYRVLSYLDPSEPNHAKLKKLMFYLLSSRRNEVIPEFHNSYSELFETLENELSTKGKAGLNAANDQAAFNFLARSLYGINPQDTELGTDGPKLIGSDNGYMYTVRYDYYPGIESMGRTERVSRKNIRSCTPCVESLENQEIGQVVEVFDESSWKMATIVKVLDNDYYLVHQTGCLKELCVHRSNTRVVQCWQDEERHLIRKGSELCRRSDQLSALKPSEKVSKVLSFSARNRFHAGDDHLASQECTELWKSHISSSLLLNRVSQVAFSKNETFRNIQDLEATERVFKRRRVVPASLKGQVNVDAKCKENIMAEKNVHDQLKDDGYCALEKTKRSGSIGYFLTRSTESSDACSVGSCSINEKFSNLSPEEVYCQGTVLCSDAESFHDSADKEERHSLSSPVKIAASIHSLELHAYRCTLEALYASGPLSWDQESLLTNLRISLHISNDEHLAELKTLISAGTGQQLDVYILCLQKSKDDACICSTSPGIIWRTPTTTVPQIRQFMAFVVITIKLHDLFCLDNFNIGMLFPEK